MSLEVSAVRHLRSDSATVALVGTSAAFPVYIFRGRLPVAMEGTGTSAILLSSRSGWTSANRHNTMRFPQLQVEIYSDEDRDENLNPDERQSARERAEAVFQAVDSVFHIPEGGEIYWDGRRILGSTRAEGEPDYSEVPDGDGLIRCLVRYDVSMG